MRVISKRNIKLFIISAFILAATLGLGFLLSISSFEDFYKNALISRFKIANEEIKNSIEMSVNFGKPIDNFSGMDKILESIVKNDAGVENAFVTSPDGTVLYSYNKEWQGRILIDELVPRYDENQKTEPVLIGGKYYVISSILYKNSDVVGSSYIEFSKKIISDKTKIVIKESLKLYLIVSMACLAVLFIAVVLIDNLCRKNKGEKRVISTFNFIIIIAVLVISNCIYSYVNTLSFKDEYIKIVDTNVDYFSKAVKREVEFFLNLGLKIDRLNKIENILQKKLSEIPECQKISITNNMDDILYSVDQDKNIVSKYSHDFIAQKFKAENYDERYFKTVVLESKKDGAQGSAVLTLNKKYINMKITDLILDSLTVVIVSIVVCFMMLITASLFSDKRAVCSKEEESDNNLRIIQVVSFIFYFGELITLSFIPILTNKLFGVHPVSFMGMSKEAIMGLPISSYMLGAAISVLFVGFISNMFSEKRIFLFCGVLLIIGAVGAAFASSVIILVIFRFISGLGYGGVSINSTNYILKHTDESRVASGFGYWTAGYAAASICAIPIGGVIVYRFGYMNALIISGIFAILFILFIINMVKSSSKELRRESRKQEKINFYDLIGIFSDRNVVANMLFTIIPFQLVYVGIFQYLMPLYMNREGISQANIGRILTIFGVVYLLVPIVSKHVDRMRNDKLFIGLGNMVIGLFLLLINVSSSFIIMIVIIIGLSLGSMMGDAAEESFVTSTEKAEEIGGAKLMSIYSTYERVVMIFAPLVIGAMISGLGYSRSVFIIGIITVVSAILFTALSENRRKGEIKNG